MKISSIKLISIFTILTLSTPKAKPISETTVTLGSIGGGLAACGVSGFVTYLVLEDILRNKNHKLLAAGGVGLIAGGITWAILRSFMSQYTPRGKFKTASKMIYAIEADSFLRNNFSCTEDVIGHVNIKFGTNWPLVLARAHLNNMVSGLATAQEILADIIGEIQGEHHYKKLLSSSNDLYNKIPALILMIEELMKPIINHPNFQHQTVIYQKHVEAERQRQFEREQQQREHLQQAREKDKDREFKQNLLQNNNRPVTVMI